MISDPIIPNELKRPGLIWGKGNGKLFAYADSQEDLIGVPDTIDGWEVVKRVTGGFNIE